MIQIHLIDEGLYAPMLVCNRCGEMVRRIGNVLWTVDPETALPNGGPFLTHKHCHDLFVAQWPDARWMWAELPTFMTSSSPTVRSSSATREPILRAAARDRGAASAAPCSNATATAAASS